MRPAKTQRHAEALAVAHADVRTKFTRWSQHRERQQIGADDEQSTRLMGLLRQLGKIMNDALRIRILHEHGGQAFGAVVLPFQHIPHLHANAQGIHAGAHHFEVVWMALVRNKHMRGPGHLRHR